MRDRETEGEGIEGGETQRIRSEKSRYVKRYREKSFQKFKFKLPTTLEMSRSHLEWGSHLEWVHI